MSTMDVDTRQRVRAFVEDIEAVLRVGVDMRGAQRGYFRNRSQDTLFASKALERAFDHAAEDGLRRCKEFLAREGIV